MHSKWNGKMRNQKIWRLNQTGWINATVFTQNKKWMNAKNSFRGNRLEKAFYDGSMQSISFQIYLFSGWILNFWWEFLFTRTENVANKSITNANIKSALFTDFTDYATKGTNQKNIPLVRCNPPPLPLNTSGYPSILQLKLISFGTIKEFL